MCREGDTTRLSATAKVLMFWAKHGCLLKIEGSYQLVAEDTPLSAPWSDNSPLCWAIGFPPPYLSAPPTILHSLAYTLCCLLLSSALIQKVTLKVKHIHIIEKQLWFKTPYMGFIISDEGSWKLTSKSLARIWNMQKNECILTLILLNTALICSFFLSQP